MRRGDVDNFRIACPETCGNGPGYGQRWPSVADIVLEAVLRQANASIPVSQYTSLRESLGEFLQLSMRAIEQGGGPHLRFLMAQAQADPDFRERFRDNFAARRREALFSILQQAAQAGDLTAQSATEAKLELLTDMIFGAMWYRLLVGHAAMDQEFADALIEVVVQTAGAGAR